MSGKIAIITGTSSGIGEALSKRLLEENWNVIGIARRPVALTHAAYRHLQGDLSDIEALTGTLIPQLECILQDANWDLLALVNNAARTGQLKNLDGSDTNELTSSLAINTVAPTAMIGLMARMCPHQIPLRIVNISSGLAHFALPGCGDYCISKAGLHMAAKVFAAEVENYGGSRHAILSYSPGTVATQMQVKLRDQSEDDFSSAGIFKAFHSQGQLVSPEEVLEPVISFLAAEDPPAYNEVSFSSG